MAKQIKLEVKTKIYGIGLASFMSKVHFLLFRDPKKAIVFAHNFAVLRITVGNKNSYHWLKNADKLKA